MNATGPQILVAFEQRVAVDKAAKAIGTARVRIDHLSFPNPIRGMVEKTIRKLERTFASEGCLDDQHRIPAVIDDSALQAALLKTGTNIGSLQGASGQLQNLLFPENMVLECLHGQHRILAASRYLHPDERWWTVDFYRTDLNDETRHSLLGGHGYSSNFTDGEVFRQMRRCQVSGDELGERRWRAMYSETKERDVAQLLRRGILLNAFDSLLPIKALWKDFRLGSLDIILHMRIDEEIAHYIRSGIEQPWNEILGGDARLMERTDEPTVKAIQLRAPGISRYDYDFIQENMAASGTLFSQIQEVPKRQGIASRLLRISRCILTIHSLFKDLRYLRPAVEAIRCLVPRQTKKTLRQNLYFHFEKLGSSRSTLQIQISERTYSTYTGNAKSLFNLAIRQLFLLAIRQLAKPARQREHGYSMFIVAEFAQSLGFASDEIRALMKNDPYQKMALNLIHRALPIPKPADRNNKTQPLATNIRELIKSLSSSAVEDSKPWLTVAGSGVPIRWRCGPEVWGDDVDSNDLKHMFLGKMHLSLAELQRGGEGISSFYVKQSIYLAFWGPLDQSDQSSALLNTVQETCNAPVYESIPSDTARADNEELAEQMDDITQRKDIPNESAPEATTLDSHLTSYHHQQVVKFSEDGVIVHETPFSKDAVNAQALRIVDSGKLLSTVQGAYFLWRNCFDMLVRTGTAVVLIRPVIRPV
ncbi:hypothetical protein V498_02409 [Pseudogymnoascus sp. VKM F-4517 (FW-2822)]|nr:hypothetical protein V498_02409 [Pseudogymnoascus sp. VKM F-4517 (FW-2822)]